MAVAYDSSAESHTGTTGSASEASFSFDLVPVGTLRGVLVFVMETADADDSTSVTADGVALSAVSGGYAHDTAGEPGSCKAWFLGSSIPAGTLTIVVNRNNNANVMYAVAIGVTADTDTAIVGTPVLLEGDGTIAEQNVDTGATAALRFAGSYGGETSPHSVGVNSTAILGIDFGPNACNTARETTGGSGSRPVGFDSGGTDDRAIVHLAIGEAAAGGNIPEMQYQYRLRRAA